MSSRRSRKRYAGGAPAVQARGETLAARMGIAVCGHRPDGTASRNAMTENERAILYRMAAMPNKRKRRVALVMAHLPSSTMKHRHELSEAAHRICGRWFYRV